MSGTRRTGDTVEVPGNYQHRATHEGLAPQRFWHQHRFAASFELLAPRTGMRALDVGCGSGVFADMLASVEGTEVLGIDANPAAVRFASEHFARSNLRFREGMLDELDLPAGGFDAISFLEVIEHVYEAQARTTLAAFHALLGPGGRLVVSTPNARSAWPAIEWLLDRSGAVPTMEDEQHVAAYQADSLRSLVESAGFRLQASRTLFVVAPWVAGLSWRAAEALHRLEQAAGTSLGSMLVQSFEKR